VTDLLADLQARDLIHSTTDREALAARLAKGPVTLYHGIDPTADSLHTGNLIGLLMLRRFQEAGHRPLALAGGATGMIGDPSGRSQERNLLDEATLNANVAAIERQIASIVEMDGADRGRLVNNYAWTKDVSLLDFLRGVGKHVTVNTMLARESVKIRMEGEDGISFTEFSYMLLQAYDYQWLAEHEGCELQVGGSDQWGNILAGVDLIRRTRRQAVHALSWPLITAPDGSKLGKTTGARIWLDPDRTSPYQFFQHWMQTEDAQVREFLAKFTFLRVADEIEPLVAAHEQDPGKREAQRTLAREVTTLVHGAETCSRVEAVSSVTFDGSPVRGLRAAELSWLAGAWPHRGFVGSAAVEGTTVSSALLAIGLVKSRSEARRLMAQHGVRLNDEVVLEDRVLAPADFLHDFAIVLKRGKRDFGVVFLDYLTYPARPVWGIPASQGGESRR